jgi:hypothetical protein
MTDIAKTVQEEVFNRKYKYSGGRARGRAGAKSGTDSAAAVANYTVVSCSSGSPGGTYASKSGPAAAAKKAATRRFDVKSNKYQLRLTLRQLGTQKQFSYECQRVKLPKPIVRNINGITVTSKFETKVKAIKTNPRT